MNSDKPKRIRDRDICAIRAAVKALNMSTSKRMLKANMEFLWHRFISHPAHDLPKHLT